MNKINDLLEDYDNIQLNPNNKTVIINSIKEIYKNK